MKQKLSEDQLKNIARSLLQTKLSISVWNGDVTAKDLSKSIEIDNGATSGAVTARLHYLPPEYAKQLGTLISRFRKYWNDNTLPWLDGSWRIISTAKYNDFKAQATAFKIEFEKCVDDMVLHYSDIVSNAPHQLGKLYKSGIIPLTSDIFKSKFGVTMRFSPVITHTDFRLEGLSAAAAAEVKQTISEQMHDQVKIATTDIIQRLKELFQDALSRISDPKKHPRYKTLVDKFTSTYQSLAALNITNDPDISYMLKSMEDLTRLDPDNLRESENYRIEAKEKTSVVLDALNNYQSV